MFFSNANKVLAILSLASAASAQQTLIAGYQARTDVDSFLARDGVQAALEGLIGAESCEALDNGKAFWESSDPNEGAYLQSIPTYKGCKSPEWREFTEFAGTDDYHIDWINAVFARGETSFANGGGDFKKGFGGPGNEGKSGNTKGGTCVGYEECVKKVTGFTFSMLESVQLMQKSVDLVEGGCKWIDGCEDAVQAWDAAVAVFVGSLEGTDGNNSPSGSYGKSLYGLSDKRCDEFATCGPNGGSVAKDLTSDSNSKILALAAGGQQAAYFALLPEMKEIKKKIYQKMGIPLIQGTLRYAYKMSDVGGAGSEATDDKTIGEGAAFSVGSFPKLWACSEKGFGKAFKEMKIGGNKAGKKAIKFNNVKLAFECNYACLGVTCAEVGSFFDGNPFPAGPPKYSTCEDDDNGSSAKKIAKCGRPSAARRQICRKFVGDPGITSSSTSCSVAPPVAAPVEPPVAAPVEPPVAAPVEPPVAAPVEPPVSNPTAAPAGGDDD